MFEGGVGRELLIFLATAGIVVPLFGRLRLGVVPGFLIAGVLLGPGGLGLLAGDFPWLRWITFSDPEQARPFAELGVIFLLFVIGLEFSVDRLWAMRRMVIGIGGIQVVATAAAIVAGALILGVDPALALVVGLALAMSSTAIVTQVLLDSRRYTGPVGRVSLGVLLFQDLMVVPIVIIVELLGGGEIAATGAVLRAVALAIAVVAGILLVGRYLTRPLLRIAAATGNRDLVIAIALFLAIGTAVLTSAAGLSPALGAFLAGLLLGESEYRHQLEVDVEPFKGLLLGLFFMTVGMSIDVLSLLAEPLTYLAAVAILVVVKGAVAFGAARAMRIEFPVSIEAAFLLAGAGEFAFVVFTIAARRDLIDASEAQFLIAIAALSMFAIPALGALGRKVAGHAKHQAAAAHHGAADGELDSLSDHVVIGGFGRVGRTIARLLDDGGIPYVALDLDSELCARERSAGRPVFYGDASRRPMLEKVGASRARAFVVTSDDVGASERTVREIRAAWPQAVVLARARDGAHARRLHLLGVTAAVPETLEGSLQLGVEVLNAIGLPEDAIDTRIDHLRAEEKRRLSAGDDEGRAAARH
ncbi:MAG TPA: cation:proton antiporter [Bauldia sp.]|nr:cation:proton antiporter [Bauldia sp.]